MWDWWSGESRFLPSQQLCSRGKKRAGVSGRKVGRGGKERKEGRKLTMGSGGRS
jgi:hypothetical protein